MVMDFESSMPGNVLDEVNQVLLQALINVPISQQTSDKWIHDVRSDQRVCSTPSTSSECSPCRPVASDKMECELPEKLFMSLLSTVSDNDALDSPVRAQKGSSVSPMLTSDEVLALARSETGSRTLCELLDYASVEMIKTIVMALAPNAVMLACHDIGCKVVQKAIDVASKFDPILRVIANALAASPSEMRKVCVDRNGNHVMQRLIQRAETVATYSRIAGALSCGCIAVDLSRHRYACRIVQKVLGKVLRGGDRSKSMVLDAITNASPDSLLALIANEFGNYTIQCCLDFGRPMDRERIIRWVIAPRIVSEDLCISKYASNVVEKSLKVADEHELDMILSVLLLNDAAGVKQAMQDQYGNYVIQSILKLPIVSPRQRSRIYSVRDTILIHADDLKTTKFGCHLVSKAKQLV